MDCVAFRKKNKILLALEMYSWCEYEYLFRAISGDFAATKEPSRQHEIPADSLVASSSPEFLKLDRCSTLSNFCTDALLTRYAGDKFERSQHAYRTQRAQIHIQVYALRERRDDPAPKTHTPATLYYLLLYYTNTHATLK